MQCHGSQGAPPGSRAAAQWSPSFACLCLPAFARAPVSHPRPPGLAPIAGHPLRLGDRPFSLLLSHLLFSPFRPSSLLVIDPFPGRFHSLKPSFWETHTRSDSHFSLLIPLISAVIASCF